MTHGRAAASMVLVTLLWSSAGVVARQLHAAQPFELNFWRSLFTAVALGLMLAWLRGVGPLLRTLAGGGRVLWGSALCWSVMFTAFMVALAMTTVANVLVTMALGPLFTALVARAVLKVKLPARTWIAIAVAGIGIAWMYGADIGAAGGRHALGVAIALLVPIAAACNWTLIRLQAQGGTDMLPALLIGALISAATTLPFALPFAADAHDIGWLAFLGVTQLAIPCLLVVRIARVLPPPELALLALLEVIFGVAWAWLGGGETPSAAVLGGGALVLGALALNEALALGGTRSRTGAR